MKKQITLLSVIGTLALILTSCDLRGKSSSPAASSFSSSSKEESSSEISSSSEPKTFTVTWKNEDGLVLELDQDVLEGTLPTYEGQTPTKPNDAQYNYVFKGWYPEVSEVTADIIYTATYQEELRKYTVTWVDEDGTVLEIDNDVPYGTTPEYNDGTPSKESTAQYTYTFDGWSNEVSEVTGDVTYTATYKEELRKYTITWVDENDNVLHSEEVAYGEVPTYDGNEPSKDSTVQHTYVFNGWTPNVVAVTGEATYKATFLEQVRTYVVRWLNYDGTVLETDEGVEYGALPSFDGTQPVRANIRGVDYSFKGWSPVISVVESDQTYTATYDYDAYFSFDLINYETRGRYELSDLRGAPWINSNIAGELNKIKKPSLKDDFYAAVNYDDIQNGILGPFEIDYVYVDQAMQAIFDNSEPTTNGGFIQALSNKLINGSTSAISAYLNNLDLDDYFNSKDCFTTTSSFFQLKYTQDDGYLLEYNDGYMEESLGLHTLYFYSMFDDYAFLESPANNIASALADILDYSLTSSNLSFIKNMERDISYNCYYDYYRYGDAVASYQVDSLPWEPIRNALLDMGLSSDDSICLKKYYINAFNSLFNDYLVNNAGSVKKAVLNRISFDYRFLLGTRNYKIINPYIVDAYVFDSEKYLGYYDGYALAKELTKLIVPILIEQSYIQIASDEDTRNNVTELIIDVIDGYYDMISEIDWLGRETKGKILEKLNKMAFASCYSDVYKNFAKIDDSNLDALSALDLFNRYALTIIDQAVNEVPSEEDAWIWDTMASYTVNAFYMPTKNSFVILNGIVPGFVGDSVEELYGMLGFVIGHEITHAFDSGGTMYDEYGNYGDIMAAADRRAFDKRVNKLISFYDKINLFDDTYVDGNTVNGEATADMGGIKVMLELAERIDGFDYDLFFRSAAKTWSQQPYYEREISQMLQDSHPFAYLRVNVTLAQFDEFIETYDIGPGDGMYIPEDQRVKVW